jgi:hypothetical protein
MAGGELNYLGTSPDSASREDDAASRRPDLRTICLCWVALGVATVVGAVAGVTWPALGPATHPHATLHPSASAVASILLNNLCVLAAPFILIAAGFDRAWRSRVAGDAVVGAILVGNAIAVGLALGRWRGTLIPFVPQLPLEYLAAATAAAAWLDARRCPRSSGSWIAMPYAAATIALTAGAAAIEVLLTPHAR